MRFLSRVCSSRVGKAASLVDPCVDNNALVG